MPAQRRVSCITRFEAVQTTIQLYLRPWFAELEVVHNACNIGLFRIEQLQKPVLHIDVVVCAREAQSSSAFQSGAGGVVQLAYQALQIVTHCSTTFFWLPAL